MTPNTFKVWQLDISEDDFNTGVEYVAIVDDPAILRMWQSFAAQKVSYKIASVDRKIVMGPLMIPNMPIFRSDDVHGEHYVMYSKESIEKIVRKFFRQKNTGNVNLMHLPAATTNEIYMIESFIIDSSRGITAPKGFDNLPDGTWFGSYQVANDEIWKAVQDGTFRGFSVEGYFSYGTPEDMPQTRIENLISAVQNGTPTQNQYLSSNTSNMDLTKLISPEKLSAVKVLLGLDPAAPVTPPVNPAPVAQADSNKAMTKDGTQLYAEGGFQQGSKLYIVTPDGQTVAPDGKYELDNGTVCEVTGGTIMNVYEAGATSADPNATTPETQMKALEEKFNAFVAETKTALAEVQQTCLLMAEKFTASEATMSGFKTELANVQEATKIMAEVFTRLENTPAHTPVDQPKENPVKNMAQHREERRASLANALSNLKKVKTA